MQNSSSIKNSTKINNLSTKSSSVINVNRFGHARPSVVLQPVCVICWTSDAGKECFHPFTVFVPPQSQRQTRVQDTKCHVQQNTTGIREIRKESNFIRENRSLHATDHGTWFEKL